MSSGQQERVERRLAAIVAIDIAGYSRLMGEDEEGTHAAFAVLRRELTDPTKCKVLFVRYLPTEILAIFLEGFRKAGMPEE